MSLLDEWHTKPGPPPDEGLSPEDVIAVTRALEAAPDVPDKRILAVRVHHSGAVLVTTGLRIGGSRLVLQKRDGEWVIVEQGGWYS
jgi:hypothetical protein